MKRILRIGVYLVSAFALPAVVFFGLPVEVPYSVVERYAFSAGAPDAAVSLAVMLPLSGPYQRVEHSRMEWIGAAGSVDSGPPEVVRLQGRTGGDGTATAVVSYTVYLKQGEARWTASDDPRYRLPQTDIESDAPEIVERAAEIKEKTVRDTAFRIFSFTARYLSWPKGTREGGSVSAVAAYRSRVGGCAEFASLMTALARADGVPARSMSGLMFPILWPPIYSRTTSWNSPAGAHAWVEIYDGTAWTFADPSWASGFLWNGWVFGRTIGAHLAYGETGAEAETYSRMLEWGKGRGTVVGAMSAPGKFVAAAQAPGVSFVPSVTIRKGWDLRWILAVAAYGAVLVAASLIERRLGKKKIPVQPVGNE